ncbi:MAG: homoserine dehydrogenase [Candidatus Methanomethylophilaceae archaeon]|nr:homoserine dehydrogenase [Candidatus Methanomethylophilaceae archaeon]
MKAFISGFGTVGQGVLELIIMKGDIISKYGDLVVTGVMDSKSYAVNDKGICGLSVLGKKKDSGKCGDKDRTGMEGKDILDMADYDVLIECTPTNIEDGGEGLKNIQHALSEGKDVITVNKGPLALKFRELSDLAEKNGCIMRYEGSVGGAMPIINMCRESLVGQKIRSINGIFNGTCNFILSRMDSGMPFQQALKEAQQLGYAETDPTYDIKGIDSACKVAILANAVFGRNVTIKDVSIIGIDTITQEAIALAAENNMVIRLIGEVSETRLNVSPRLIPKGHPLSITGTLNTAVVETDFAGPVTVSGRGAGRKETASAILSDLIAIMKERK